MKVFLIAGKAGSGKNEVANIIKDELSNKLNELSEQHNNLVDNCCRWEEQNNSITQTVSNLCGQTDATSKELETIKMALSKTDINEEYIILNEALIYYYL